MKKYIYVLGGIVIIGGFFLIINSGESVKNPLNSNNNEKTSIKNLNTKSIDSISNNDIKKFSQKMNVEQTNKIPEIQDNKVKISHLVNNVSSNKVSQKIAVFIENNNLQDIKDLPQGISIFAQNPPQKNEFTPPSPPTLIRVKFKEGNSIIPLNSNLINSNKKIYVVKKEKGKFVEIKAIDTKKLKSFTPPSIGQN